jgi:hypothetical protein
VSSDDDHDQCAECLRVFASNRADKVATSLIGHWGLMDIPVKYTHVVTGSFGMSCPDKVRIVIP